MFARYDKYKDDEYIVWIRNQPSIISDTNPPSDPHHVWCSGGGGGKRNDYLAVPLTRAEHSLYHQKGHDWFEEAYNISFENEIIRLLTRYLSIRENSKGQK